MAFTSLTFILGLPFVHLRFGTTEHAELKTLHGRKLSEVASQELLVD